MRTFRQGNVPSDPKQLPAYVLELEKRIQRSANAEDGYLGVAPDRPQDRPYLFAAGVVGVNRGAYRYDSLSGTWTFIA